MAQATRNPRTEIYTGSLPSRHTNRQGAGRAILGPGPIVARPRKRSRGRHGAQLAVPAILAARLLPWRRLGCKGRRMAFPGRPVAKMTAIFILSRKRSALTNCPQRTREARRLSVPPALTPALSRRESENADVIPANRSRLPLRPRVADGPKRRERSGDDRCPTDGTSWREDLWG